MFPDIQAAQHPLGHSKAPQSLNAYERAKSRYFGFPNVADNDMGSVELTENFGVWRKIDFLEEPHRNIAEFERQGGAEFFSASMNSYVSIGAQIVRTYPTILSPKALYFQVRGLDAVAVHYDAFAARNTEEAYLSIYSGHARLLDASSSALGPPHSAEEIRLFAAGVNGVKPSDTLSQMVANVARQAIALLTEPEIAFDDEDGSLNFDLRLNNGHTMFIELYPDGRLFLGVYDVRGEGDSETILLLDNPNEKQILELFGEK